MIINFEKIEEVTIKNFRGGEKETLARMFTDEKNKIVRFQLDAGASIGVHTHETSSEIIYFLKGTGRAFYDGAYEEVKPGLCHYCPKGHEHGLINDSSDALVFFAVVAEQ